MKDMTERQLIEDLLSALEYHTEQTRPIQFSKVAIAAAREYLRKPAQQKPVAGEGKEFSERLKLCARNVAFVAAGRVDMSSAAMQEMFALIDHVCVGIDSPPAQQDIPDLIAGAFGVSSGTAYDMMREALAEQSAQQNGPWCMKMNGCKTKCEDCPDEVAEQPAQPQPTIYVDPDAIRILLDPDHSGFVTARLTRHKPDPMRGSKVGLSITKGNT